MKNKHEQELKKYIQSVDDYLISLPFLQVFLFGFLAGVLFVVVVLSS